MKANFKKLTSILCVAAILVSSISVAAYACLFCGETTTETPTESTTIEEPSTEPPVETTQPPVETTTKPSKPVPPPKIPPTDSF